MKNRPCTETHEAHPPRSFRERLQSLAGTSTWREPMAGHSTQQRAVPAAHELAAALGMARTAVCAACKAPWYECRNGRCAHCDATTTMPDPTDIGPDIACDVIFASTTYAGRVTRAVAAAMAHDRARAIKRCRPWLRVICWAAYSEVVHGARQPQLRPGDMDERDWDMLTNAAALIMERLAEDSVARAARAWRRAA